MEVGIIYIKHCYFLKEYFIIRETQSCCDRKFVITKLVKKWGMKISFTKKEIDMDLC